jgi:hypothetical protein
MKVKAVFNFLLLCGRKYCQNGLISFSLISMNGSHQKTGAFWNKGHLKTGAIDSFTSQVPAKYQSKQAQIVGRKVQESGRCVWPGMNITENWGCQEMWHLIGLLMAVFQVFATLNISGRRKKELETQELYLLDDRVIIRHSLKVVSFMSCLFLECRSDQLLSHYFNLCYYRL